METVHFMIKHLSGMKYCYKEIVEGCYDTAIQNFNLPEPPEGKEVTVNKVIEILKEEK